MNREEHSVFVPVTKMLPPVAEPVVVASKNSQRLGWLDADGVWRRARDCAEIKEVIGWYRFRIEQHFLITSCAALLFG